jgi:hypothetical protein
MSAKRSSIDFLFAQIFGPAGKQKELFSKADLAPDD